MTKNNQHTLMYNSLNRTILELKAHCTVSVKNDWKPLNRTILELKVEFISFNRAIKFSLNRTILELKVNIFRGFGWGKIDS